MTLMAGASLPATTMSSTTQPAETPVKPPGGGRLPSLNQLAARINLNQPNGAPASSASAPRPRLAASMLRTGSNASISTTASTADSMTVNVPNTRSTSPSALSTSAPKEAPSEGDDGGDELTSDKLDQLNQETVAAPEKRATKVGYKNIPSLDAIADRLAKARALSVDGTAKPPEAEMIEDPKTPGVRMKIQEHPLQFTWTIYHDSKAKAPHTPATAAPQSAQSESSLSQPTESVEYEAGLSVIGEFDTVEEFCRYFNWLKPPSKLEKNSNYHVFKSGIKPMWEDPANANGGKWVLTMKNNPGLLDRCWNWLAMALIGEQLEDADEICGAVVSLRTKVDRIQLWTRGKEDVERLNGIGKKLMKLLDISEADGIGLEFQYNTDDRPLPNKFISVQSMPTTGFRSTFSGGSGGVPPPGGAQGLPNNPISGNSFGSFGMPVGGAGAWKPSAKRA